MRRLLVASALVVAVPVAVAQDSLSKGQIIDRAAGICRDLNEDVAPHVQKLRHSEKRRAVVRHGRRFIRTSRPHVKDLAELTPPEGARRYRRFVGNTDRALDLLEAALDALDARRGRLARRRADASTEAAGIARRAAKRYGLRRSCIRYLS